MAYYHILKKRRLDLNLSVQDIAIQTHLAPEYIRAIEENNLDVFSDDFSFVRYFTRAYCDAIGVNWEAIAPEVDATISLYARAKDQALTQAQRRMVENMPSSKTRTRKKSKKKSSSKMHKVFAASAGKISRTMNWDSKNRLTKSLIIGGCCVIVFLIVLNTLTDSMARRNQENAKAAKEQELLEKEQETQKLAEQLQAQKKAAEPADAEPALTVTADAGKDNHFSVVTEYAADKKVKVDFTVVEPTNIEILLSGTVVFNQEVSKNTDYDLPLNGPASVEIRYSNFKDGDYITLDGASVPVDGAKLTGGSGSVFISFKEDEQKASDQKASDQSSQNATHGYDKDGDEYYYYPDKDTYYYPQTDTYYIPSTDTLIYGTNAYTQGGY